MKQILIDTSPLFAVCDKKEGKLHLKCKKIFDSVIGNFITTLPCLAESMYFLGESRGWNGQERLWNLIETESLKIHH